MIENSEVIKAINTFHERIELSEKEISRNILNFNACLSALIEVLGLSVDQLLDFQNLSRKKYEEMIKEFNDKQGLK